MDLTSLLEQIERLDKAATKGISRIEDPSHSEDYELIADGEYFIPSSPADTEWIILARTALPLLAQIVRRQREALVMVKATCGSFDEVRGDQIATEALNDINSLLKEQKS